MPPSRSGITTYPRTYRQNQSQDNTDNSATTIASKVSTPASAILAKPRPIYSDSTHQALSRVGACFTCHQPSHIAKDSPSNSDIKAMKENEDVKDTDDTDMEDTEDDEDMKDDDEAQGPDLT